MDRLAILNYGNWQNFIQVGFENVAVRFQNSSNLIISLTSNRLIIAYADFYVGQLQMI